MKALQRALVPRVLDALKGFPAVYINGPRQAGKTTLVKMLLGSEFEADFVTFDDTLERAAAVRNPLGYLKESGKPLIIDEVQLVPGLFRPLKRLVDERRETALRGGGTNLTAVICSPDRPILPPSPLSRMRWRAVWRRSRCCR